MIGSVIIVNYNGGEMLQEAIRSVLDQSIAEHLEIILVDNGSLDGSADAAHAEFGDRIKLLRSAVNLGFAGGNNLGIRRARGKYLLLLNNDAAAEPTWAERLIAAVEADPTLGMATPKIVTYHQPGVLDNAGHLIYPDGLNRSRGHLAADSPEYNQPAEVLFASGCAGLYQRDAVIAQGGFDEDFFAYGDDADLGFKLRLLNLGCRYVPTAVVRHRQSASSGAFSLKKLYWIERNRIWVMLKYMPWAWVIASPWYTFMRLWASWRASRAGEGLAGRIGEEHPPAALLRTILKAWVHALIAAPRMLTKRRRLMAAAKVNTASRARLLRQYRASTREMGFG